MAAAVYPILRTTTFKLHGLLRLLTLVLRAVVSSGRATTRCSACRWKTRLDNVEGRCPGRARVQVETIHGNSANH